MTPEQRFKCMSNNRAKNTGPELLLRHALWHLGFRYRVNDKRLPGTPDIVLPKYRTVIFVHGCFWHGHRDCKNASTPKTNTAFWTAKIQRNQQRDQEVWRQLEAKGWSVIIVWECQLKKAVMEETIQQVEAEILHNGEILRSAQDDRRRAREEYRQEMKARKEREAALKAGLRKKLAAVYDSTSISDYAVRSGKSEIIDLLADAVKNHRQVQLKGYSSNHSGETKDYTVEPYKFTKEFADIIAYDTKDGINKLFKISRMGDVRVLGDWEHEDAHQEQPIDAFRMSGHPVEHVKLRLTLRAKNLLTEEFPITCEQVYPVKRNWHWEGDVNALEGIGRFVLGLASEITVEEGEQLKAWLCERGAYIQRKFRK